MANDPEARGKVVVRLVLVAVTLAATLVAFAALDDITTGNETDFTLEYAALVAYALWLLFLVVRLLRPRHHVPPLEGESRRG